VAEALALGTPVITTTGTPWQGLETHKCGWWIDPTVDALTETFKNAIKTEDRLQMGQRGSDWVRKEFAWDEIGKRMFAAYQDILNGH